MACIIVGGLVAIGVSGLGKGRLQAEAQAALTDLVGEEVSAQFGDARLVFNGPSLVSLEIRDVHLAGGRETHRKVTAQRLRFGVALWPLLQGRLELTGARLDGASIAFGTREDADAPAFLDRIRNERGLIDPDFVAREVLAAADRVVGVLAGKQGAVFRLSNLSIDRVPGRTDDDILVTDAVLEKQPGNVAIRLSGTAMSADFRAEADIGFAGTADGKTIFQAKIEVPALELRGGRTVKGDPMVRFQAAANLVVSGTRIPGSGAANLEARLRMSDAVLTLADGGRQEGDYEIAALLQEGSGKVEFERVVADIGRTQLRFHGALGPAPETGDEPPVYRYEMVSDGSRIAPADSPEPALSILARVAGILDPHEGRITADEIGVRTTHGEVVGNGALVFPGGKTPAAFLAISATDIPVSHAKQLWPWRAADGARAWVLDNVFGGTVRTSRVELSTVAGRFGDGIPFGPEEISGFFAVEDTRFNTAGEIPPVRDANGYVDFKGRTVRIGLASGTVYLPSGRNVNGTNGTLDIAVEQGKPLTGALEVDVSGDADAITELASFDPIGAGRYLDLAPDDFSGKVSGHVSGIIPLQSEYDEDLVSWNVALDYDSLAIAKPFDGQVLTDATGSIRVDPNRAIIEARGLLNGLPAVFSLVEPLEGGNAEGRRDIRFELDEKARAKIAPGLNTIVEGPIVVEVTRSASGGHAVVADLAKAVLKFPWAGWSKGAGIPAEMSFTMSEAGEEILLDDMRIAGDGFAIAGSATVTEGSIARADFSRVSLNRDDRFSLSIERHRNGYKLAITGERIDARSLVKQILSEPEIAEAGLEDTPIWLTVRSNRVLGFGNEELSDVSIGYMGRGTTVAGLELSATTDTGHRFTARADEDGGRRNVQMQSSDAGSILRFLNLYANMEGGSIDLRLSGASDGPLVGQIDARDFWLVNEPRLKSLVASAPEGGGQGLAQQAPGKIEVTRAKFERGFSRIEKGDDYLAISEGVLRGPQIGSTFQGTLYDAQGRIAITGTFMPAYGLNRMFAEIPIVGLVLGNGRDRALIGITYKLSGDAKAPQLAVNPISAIAPGIFRNIFEFR